ncbi:MAG: hypothetical protein CMJ46_07320 [Planctomyces sp.]|nr:hypothetical protein [Planctomyces sp.]
MRSALLVQLCPDGIRRSWETTVAPELEGSRTQSIGNIMQRLLEISEQKAEVGDQRHQDESQNHHQRPPEKHLLGIRIVTQHGKPLNPTVLKDQ